MYVNVGQVRRIILTDEVKRGQVYISLVKDLTVIPYFRDDINSSCFTLICHGTI